MLGDPLDRIRIAGFKSFGGDFCFDLRRLNILIGANGAGKSNFIGTFKLLNQLVERNLQLFVATSGGADSILHFGRKRTDKLELELIFGRGANRYACTFAPTADDSLVFSDESVTFFKTTHIPVPYTKSLGAGHAESLLPDLANTNQVAQHVLDDIRRWTFYHFHDTSDGAKLKQTADVDDNLALRSDAGNLPAFLYMLSRRHSPSYRKIVETIRLVAPFFEDFRLQPSRLNPDKIRLEWKEQGSDAYMNASALSDGTLRFICLATLLLQPDPPPAILLDEPELGLHPLAIAILADLLKTVSAGGQVIVSTQSVTLINHFLPGEVVVVERKHGGTVLRHADEIDLSAWLDEYSVGELWEKNVLGGRP